MSLLSQCNEQEEEYQICLCCLNVMNKKKSINDNIVSKLCEVLLARLILRPEACLCIDSYRVNLERHEMCYRETNDS